jgi:5'-nucleotidase / UDP-sugar diphosphatase
MSRRAALPALLLLLAACASQPRSVTLVHFTDYHSHALPSRAAGEPAGGIARAVAWLEPLAQRDDVLVFSGGDMMNRGAPAWSDRFGCVEWPWLNGIVAAMALGNHDADYGAEAFARCRSAIDYPILSSNVLSSNGRPLFERDGTTYAVFVRRGIRFGVFALAGDDFERLMTPGTLPAEGIRFAPRAGTARAVVSDLRERERVDLVVLIGHASRAEDEALAREVGGIDLIFGTHGHETSPLQPIEGTATRYISACPYLRCIARVEVVASGGGASVAGGTLVPMTASLPEHPEIARRVETLQAALQADEAYRHLFEPLAVATAEIGLGDLPSGEAPVANLLLDMVREAIGADLAVATSSSFRAPLPAGTIRLEDIRASLPYENAIFVYELGGSDLRTLFELSAAARGTDTFLQISGARLVLRATALSSVQTGAGDLADDATYRVAVPDFMVRVAEPYRTFFASRTGEPTGRKMRELATDRIAELGTISPPPERRIGGDHHAGGS